MYRLPGVGFVRGGAQRYEEGNALGSLLAVQDASGSVVGQTEYDAYGREVYASGSDRGDLRFAGAKGYVNDDATGMRMLGARYYLPVLGRFLTPDPIGHDGGLNLYAYCGDSPLSRVDPKGAYEIRLGWHSVGGVANHAFILVTDNERLSKTYGWTWSFSAGPERYGLESLTNPGLLTDYSSQYNRLGYRDGQGRWVGAAYDSPAIWNIGQTRLYENNYPVAPLLGFLRQSRSEFASWGATYNLLDGPNSNSFAQWILGNISVFEDNNRAINAGNWATGRIADKSGSPFPGWRR